jgi:hypothetical protein
MSSLKLAIVLALPLTAAAEDAPKPAPTTKPPACSAPEHRQFDFWIGDWDVTSGGKRAGQSHVEKILGGCVIFENWTGAGGSEGKSFNLYDATKKRWQQTWVDASGGLIEFHGELREGNMCYTTQSPTLGPDGQVLETLGRMTFFPQGASVRQLWEQSVDGGKTWIVAFDGLYSRKLAR